MANKPRAKMPVSQRAKQFMPFAALKGLEEALAKKEKVVVPRVELSEEMAVELNHKISALHKGSVATITYFYDDEYLQITGMVAQIDKAKGILRAASTKIPIDDILDVELLEEKG